MMAMMGGGREEEEEGVGLDPPPRRGASAHLERRSVTPPAGAVSLFRSTFRQKKKQKKQINLGRAEVPPGGTFRPGKGPTRRSVLGEVGSLRRSHCFVSLFC